MALLIDPPFALGQTLGVTSTSQGTGWVGAVKQFPDVNPSTGVRRTNRVKTCIAVRNTSGVALLPKRVVSFAAGSLSAVDGYTRDTGLPAGGIVDEHLPADGVANNDVFWLTIQGPTEVKVGVGLQAAVDTTLVSLTAAASTASTTAGQAQTAANTFLPVNYIGRALGPAVTSSNSGSPILAVVNLVRS